MCKCSLKKCCLEHDQPELFVNSQWPIRQVIYFIWRLVVAILFVVWIIISGAVDPGEGIAHHREKWFIYITYWAFFLLTINTLIEVISVGMDLRNSENGCNNARMPDSESSTQVDSQKGKPDGNKVPMPWFYKMSWVLYNVATPLGLAVPVGFWVARWAKIDDSFAVTNIGYGPHAVNAFYILVNIFITGIPVRIHHFWHCLVVSTIYIPFSVIYQKSGGTNTTNDPYIYKVLNWDCWTTAAGWAIALGIVAPIVSWLIVYGLYQIRIAIFKGCGCKRNNKVRVAPTSENK